VDLTAVEDVDSADVGAAISAFDLDVNPLARLRGRRERVVLRDVQPLAI
jgi:hypothetical protein